MSPTDALIESVYREHSARLLAVLVRIFGTRNLDLAEDVLQEAFRKALVIWSERGAPDNPSAWIVAAAKNHAVDVIRAQRTRTKFAEDLRAHLESDWTLSYTVEQEFSELRIQDDQLRMIFMCANADLKAASCIPLMLRSLCGFSIPAICRALVLPESTVKKRLLRARERLKGQPFEFPEAEQLPHSMERVHTVLYLLFNEGFQSAEDGTPNLDLCREAMALADQLIEEPRVVDRDTLGLLALMNFHLARSDARVDENGLNVALDLQDRGKWDRRGIERAEALLRLARAVGPGVSGRFHVEAQIAAQHCRAMRFEETDWQAILSLYDELVQITDSPVARLNRAVALGYAGDARLAIAQVLTLREDERIGKSHLPAAILAHMHAMLGEAPLALRYAEESEQLGGTPQEQRVMRQQVERLLARRAGAPPAGN